jgi:hypothetical protein
VRNLSIALIAIILAPLAFSLTGSLPTASAAQSPQFQQCANADPTEGTCVWIGSILQSSNSIYFEGMSVMERLILTSIPATASNTHVLTFKVQASRDAIHAYDFLTSWSQAVAAANAVDPTLLSNIDECGEDGSGACAGLVASPNKATPPVYPIINIGNPPGTLAGDNVNSVIAAYESQFGTIFTEIFVRPIAPISDAAVTFTGYETSGGNSYAGYSITWNSASDQALIRFAGHLACGASDDQCPGGSGVVYPSGEGSANISGGPYHFKLGDLDGISLGSMDNAIRGASILVAPPPPVTGEITIQKTAQGGDTTFSYTGTESSGTSFPTFAPGFSIPTSGGTGSQTSTITFAQGSTSYTVTVTEIVPVGWELVSIACLGGGSSMVDLGVHQVQIIISPTQGESCTFTNAKLGSLTVVKNTVGGADGTFTFTASPLSGTLTSPFQITTVQHSGSTTFDNMDPTNSYTISETGVFIGFALTGSSCTGAGNTPSDFMVPPGGTVTCTFTNTVAAPEYPFGVILLLVALAGIYGLMHRRMR